MYFAISAGLLADLSVSAAEVSSGRSCLVEYFWSTGCDRSSSWAAKEWGSFCLLVIILRAESADCCLGV